MKTARLAGLFFLAWVRQQSSELSNSWEALLPVVWWISRFLLMSWLSEYELAALFCP